MDKIHIFSTPRSGTHYLESLISGMTGIPIVPTPFEERKAFELETAQLSTEIDEFNAIGSRVCKTHPNWLFPYYSSVTPTADTIIIDKFKYATVPTRDMLPLVDKFIQGNDYTIGLIRLNITEAALSFALAYHNYMLDKSKTGSFRPPYNNNTVTIDKDNFMQLCKKILAIYDVMTRQVEVKCDKVIFYEDLKFDSSDALLTEITPTHDIPSSVKQAKSKKITIANYDELYEYAIKFFNTNQQLHTFSITDGVIKDINLNNIQRPYATEVEWPDNIEHS